MYKNRFNTWAEPGPIDNSDFVCVHGGVRVERAPHLAALAAKLPQPLWEFLHTQLVYVFQLTDVRVSKVLLERKSVADTIPAAVSRYALN